METLKIDDDRGWAWLADPGRRATYRGRPPKLTREAILTCRYRYVRGLASQKQMAGEHGVSVLTMHKVCSFRSARHVVP